MTPLNFPGASFTGFFDSEWTLPIQIIFFRLSFIFLKLSSIRDRSENQKSPRKKRQGVRSIGDRSENQLCGRLRSIGDRSENQLWGKGHPLRPLGKPHRADRCRGRKRCKSAPALALWLGHNSYLFHRNFRNPQKLPTPMNPQKA